MLQTILHAIWDRWVNWHPFVRFLVLVGVVGGLGLLTAKPAYRKFKAWRMERNLEAAKQAVADVRMDEARDLSLTVLRTGDPCIEAFRILEKSMASLQDPRHRDVARALMSHPEGSDEDRLHGFIGLAPEAPLGLVGQGWVMLPAKCHQDPRFATVFAERLIAGNRLQEAASVLLAVPEANRTDESNRCLIRVLIASGKREGFDQAQRLIATGLQAADRTQLGVWLDLLEAIPAVSLQGATLEPVRRVLDDPAAAEPARRALMLARMEYASQFNRRAAVLDEAIRRWQDHEPVAVARFLLDLGLYQRLLETIPVTRVGSHPGLFPHLLAAMERAGAWEQVVPLLESAGHEPLPKYEELGLRALAAAKTGDSPGHVQAWGAAIHEARTSTNPSSFLKLHQWALAAGMTGDAEQAMVEAIRRGAGPLPLYTDLQSLLNSLAGQGRESVLLEICAIYLAFEPGNPVLLTQYAYLACLTQRVEPKLILKAMESLAKGFPKELPIQCVLATVYLCDGQPDKAAATLDPFALKPDKLAPPYRATFLTSEVLNHRLAKDDPLITEFPWKSLLPCERKTFSDLIRLAVVEEK